MSEQNKFTRWNLPPEIENIKDPALKAVLRDIYEKLNAFHAGQGITEEIKGHSVIFRTDDAYILRMKDRIGQSGT